MNKKVIVIGLIILLIVIISGIFLAGTEPAKTTGKSVLEVTPIATTAPETLVREQEKSYTGQEVKKHNSEKDCWTAIGSKVYDITSFIEAGVHGKSVLLACGKDATDIFSQYHGNSAKNVLEKYYIGALA